MKRAGVPESSLRRVAASIDFSDRSVPVTVAPSRAQEMVSVPMWHCRWSRLFPVTSPSFSLS